MTSERTGHGIIAGYTAMIVAAIGVFFVVRSIGMKVVAPAPTTPPLVRHAGPGGDVLLQVLLALLAIIVVTRICGQICRLIQQPPVIGEVIGGILIGPSLLGRIAPELSAYLLPASVTPLLSIIAQIGVILFMFLVGLELDTGRIKNRTESVIAISHASIVVPFTLGVGMALWLYPRLSSSDVPFTVFALFIGVSLSVTAFPVLARILTDRNLQRTELGVLSLTCAAVDDVTAWCLLAFLMAVANSAISGAAVTFGLTGLYVAFMLVVARPLINRAVQSQETKIISQGAFAIVVICLLLSTLATEATGIHAIFGAFLLGAMIPHDSRLARDLTYKLRDFVVVLFLPAFFAFTGLRTQIGLVHGASQWMICVTIILIASLGKFGGSFVAARATGSKNREAAALGILMNTRGLMELIVLNVGLDLHILSPTLFAMLVLMAVITTFATTPILHLITRGSLEAESAAMPAVAQEQPQEAIMAGA